MLRSSILVVLCLMFFNGCSVYVKKAWSQSNGPAKLEQLRQTGNTGKVSVVDPGNRLLLELHGTGSGCRLDMLEGDTYTECSLQPSIDPKTEELIARDPNGVIRLRGPYSTSLNGQCFFNSKGERFLEIKKNDAGFTITTQTDSWEVH